MLVLMLVLVLDLGTGPERLMGTLNGNDDRDAAGGTIAIRRLAIEGQPFRALAHARGHPHRRSCYTRSSLMTFVA